MRQFTIYFLLMVVFTLLPNSTSGAVDKPSSLDRQAQSKVIKSSVSDEFKNGLHEKYLRYLADKMGMQLEIMPMPFTRRVLSLRRGVIDIMTGLKSTHLEQEEFIFLQPSYERLRNAYFVRTEDRAVMENRSDLRLMTIAITSDEKVHLDSLRNEGVHFITVSSLEQKIDMLLKGRIDMFSHFEFSTQTMLKDLNLEDQIVLSDYQTNKFRDYHFALSNRSHLLSRKNEMEDIIRQGVENGDFLAIREAHYRELNGQKD